MKKFIAVMLFCCLPILSCANAITQHVGPTQACDDLWQIAVHIASGKSVTPQQTMLALVHRNPRAFYRRNVNGLKYGYVLKVPSTQEIHAIKPHFAVQEIKRQNRQWQMIKKQRQKRPTPQYRRLRKKTCSSKRLTIVAKHVKHFAIAANTLSLRISQLSQQIVTLQEKFSIVHNNNMQLLAQLDQLYNQNMKLTAENTLLKQHIEQLEQTQLQLQQEQTKLKAEAAAPPTISKLVHLLSKVSSSEQVPANDTNVTTSSNNIMMGISHFIATDHLINLLKQQQFKTVLVIIGAVLILLLILFLLISIKRHHKKHQTDFDFEEEADIPDETQAIEPQEETPEEQIDAEQPEKSSSSTDYHYLSGEDVIASKLDLAQAYVDMGDQKSAKKLLQSVIQEGDAAQRKEAEQILKKL